MRRHDGIAVRCDGELAHQSHELTHLAAVDFAAAEHVGHVVDDDANRFRRLGLFNQFGVNMRSRSRGTVCPGFAISFAPSSNRGRRESRAPTAPAAPCAMGSEKNAHGFDRYSRDIPAFPAQWLYGLLRALPGERPLLSPLPRQHGPAGIDARVAAPGPHDFAVRRQRFVRCENT